MPPAKPHEKWCVGSGIWTYQHEKIGFSGWKTSFHQVGIFIEQSSDKMSKHERNSWKWTQLQWERSLNELSNCINSKLDFAFFTVNKKYWK